MKSQLFSEEAGVGTPERVSRRVAAISVSATKLMPILAGRIGGCVSLGQGIPSFSTPSHIIEAVCTGLKENPGSGKYSLQPGMAELRRAISGMMKAEKNIESDPENEILVTVGAMEGLLASILTVVDRGDEVIIPSPAYASHIEQVLLAEGIPVFVPLRREDWGLDVAAIRQALSSRTRALILCNPSNPTGAVFSDSDVRELCELSLRHGFVIISDETYDVLVYDAPPPFSPASLPELKENVISIFSLSKRYAMTGWRVGWAAASNRWMSQMVKVHDSAAICAPMPSQLAALAALTGPQDCVSEMRAALAARRDLCCRRLDALSEHFEYIRPAGAFYLMARYLFSGAPSREVAVRILNEARVITVPGGSFGAEGEGHLRLSYGGDENELNAAFDRIEGWLRGLRE